MLPPQPCRYLQAIVPSRLGRRQLSQIRIGVRVDFRVMLAKGWRNEITSEPNSFFWSDNEPPPVFRGASWVKARGNLPASVTFPIDHEAPTSLALCAPEEKLQTPTSANLIRAQSFFKLSEERDVAVRARLAKERAEADANTARLKALRLARDAAAR
jgi:hypothetical protein